MCEIIFAILIFAISNENTFELGDRINYCGFYFRDSLYSPRNCENKNPAKISRYTILLNLVVRILPHKFSVAHMSYLLFGLVV